MDKKLMKIDFQGTVKEYNEKLERNNINLQLELVQYGHFSPGFWTMEDSLLFYFELISGLFNNDTLFVFCSEQTECLWPVLLALMEERTMATTHWQRRQFVIHSIIKALSEEYKQQFAKLTSVSDNGRENLLVTDLYHINKAWRQMSSLKQSLDDFVGSLEKLANTWQDAANVSACDENQSLSESSYMRIADIALVVADTIDTLERVEQNRIDLKKRRQKYSQAVKQEYLGFLEPFVFQRFLVCLFTWNALLIESFHSNLIKIDTILGFVTLTVGAPVTALVAIWIFAKYYRRKGLSPVASKDTDCSG